MSNVTSVPVVSVVIPTFNRSLELLRCLDSLERQTLTEDFEVIVVDDGSTDNTSEVVKNYKSRFSLKYFQIENFGGPARPRNIGINKSTGEFIAFLDSDDWYKPEKLEVSLRYLRIGADLVYHDLIKVTRKGPTSDRERLVKTRTLKKPVFEDLLINGTTITNSSVVVRRSVIEDAGAFSEERSLIAAEDFDAWLRISKVTDNFVRVEDALGFYWAGGGNISNPDRTIENYYKLIEIYKKDFSALLDGQLPSWMNYDLSRSYLYKASLDESIKYGKAALLNKNFGLIKLKYILSLCQIYLKNWLSLLW